MAFHHFDRVMAALFLVSSAIASDELPAAHGPPKCSNPLSWGFYSTHEMQIPVALEIEGMIPSWLSGSLYRGAAATWDVGNLTAEHWFDGFSRHHSFVFADGGVTYRSRNGSDELAEFVRETGLLPNSAFGSDPCKIIFGAFETTFRDATHSRGDKSSETVSVSWIRNFPGLARNTSDGGGGGPFDTLVATTDGSTLQQINPMTLEPIELFTYEATNPLLKNMGLAAAHPASFSDGSIYNYNLDLKAQPPTYHVFSIMAPDGQTKILANISDAPPAYLHSLFNTENYVVLIVWQADYTQSGRTLMESMGPWVPERPVFFYVIDRFEGGVIAKYVYEQSFFAFHQINSYEAENGDIIIDLPRMDDLSFINNAHVDNLRANLGPKANSTSFSDIAGEFTRFRLPYHAPSTNGTIVTHLAEVAFTLPYKDANIELPRVNEAFSGKAYRYSWGVHAANPGYFADSVIKIDAEMRSVKVWEPATPHLPSEPIFVATPGADREDDGLLLLVAMDAAERLSSMVVLNATTMEEVGRARMPIVMGYGFHGIWGSAV